MILAGSGGRPSHTLNRSNWGTGISTHGCHFCNTCVYQWRSNHHNCISPEQTRNASICETEDEVPKSKDQRQNSRSDTEIIRQQEFPCANQHTSKANHRQQLKVPLAILAKCINTEFLLITRNSCFLPSVLISSWSMAVPRYLVLIGWCSQIIVKRISRHRVRKRFTISWKSGALIANVKFRETRRWWNFISRPESGRGV